MLEQCFLSLNIESQNHLESLFKTQIHGFHPRGSDLVGLWWGICILTYRARRCHCCHQWVTL